MAWLKPQSVDGSAACYSIGAIICSLPRAFAPARELGAASCLCIGAEGQAGWNSVPLRSMACMMMARRRASAIRAMRMVVRAAIANAQFFSFNSPL